MVVFVRQNTLGIQAMLHEANIVKLSEVLDAESAESLVSSYSNLDSLPEHLRIDAADVEHVTTVGIQSLIALMRNGAGSNAAATIVHASPSFRAAWRDFGLDHHFPLEQ